MPAWMHDRAEHILAKNPSMPKGEAFAIATQQSHALGKSPKGYGTAAGRRTAKAKYDTPGDDEKRAVGLLSTIPGTEGIHLPGFSGILDKVKTINAGGTVAPRPAKSMAQIFAGRQQSYRPMAKQAVLERLGRLALTDVPGTPRLLMRQRSPTELAGVQGAIEGAFRKVQDPLKARVARAASGIPGDRFRSAVTHVANTAIDNPELIPMSALPVPGLTPAYLAAKKGLERGLDRFAPMKKISFNTSQYSGPLSYGPFQQASRLAPYKQPSLAAPVEKNSEGLPDGVTYKPGDFKQVKLGAGLIPGPSTSTPAGGLAASQSVGKPKVGAPPGPSISDIAKPKGPGTGMPLPGAMKTGI